LIIDPLTIDVVLLGRFVPLRHTNNYQLSAVVWFVWRACSRAITTTITRNMINKVKLYLL